MWYIRSMLPTLSALAAPNRLRIVELLREGPRPVGEIAVALRLRQPQVSKHLRVLSEAGLVEVHPLAQQRIYRLRAEEFIVVVNASNRDKDLAWMRRHAENFDVIVEDESDLRRLIREAGRIPVERDTLYNELRRDAADHVPVAVS